jgi:hypothetical protein
LRLLLLLPEHQQRVGEAVRLLQKERLRFRRVCQRGQAPLRLLLREAQAHGKRSQLIQRIHAPWERGVDCRRVRLRTKATNERRTDAYGACLRLLQASLVA